MGIGFQCDILYSVVKVYEEYYQIMITSTKSNHIVYCYTAPGVILQFDINLMKCDHSFFVVFKHVLGCALKYIESKKNICVNT